MNKKLPKSIRKHIRKEKARIRREVFYAEEQKKSIDELYKKLLSSPEQLKQEKPEKNKVKKAKTEKK